MKKWYLSAKKAEFTELATKYNIDPVIARIMINRDVTDIDTYLYGALKDMHNPMLMKDMKKAVQILTEKIFTGKSIRVIGDYDVDGATATSILYKGLLKEGANVDYTIPHRIEDGYGLNIKIIEEAIKDKIDTIITCDNGIAAYEQIEYAKKNGLTVIITDHHEVPYEEEDGNRTYILPPADAIINPKQEDCPYPFKGICGAVVAYKLIQALSSEPMNPEYLALATLGTVCDVMDLVDENRIIVKEGIKILKSNKGIKELIKVNGLDDKKISGYHIGFIIGPCVNASGRLDTALKAVRLFCSESEEEISILANELKTLNDERKELTHQGVCEAVEYIKAHSMEKDKALVVLLNCHESIAGIIAGRIREQYNRPTIVFSKTEDGLKGSGRSVESYNMYEELNNCKDLIVKFGGHKMAAGLAIKEENLDAFRNTLNTNCLLNEKDFEEKVLIDVAMPLSYVSESLVEQFQVLEPFGVGNKKPVFAQKDLTFISGQLLGKNSNVGKYKATDGDRIFTIMFFGPMENFHEFLDEKYGKESFKCLYEGKAEFKVSILYYPEINEFRDKKDLQFIMQDFC